MDEGDDQDCIGECNILLVHNGYDGTVYSNDKEQDDTSELS